MGGSRELPCRGWAQPQTNVVLATKGRYNVAVDPITQGTLGAAAALVFVGRRSPLRFSTQAWLGALSGMAPDLDVFIRSASDPLLAIEYHRHFTHSLAFIPVGGVLTGLPFLALPALRPHWRSVLLVTTIGLGTHGLLDACTTYGTLLWWPFSDHRASWNLISIIDPWFTLPLLVAVIWAVKRRSAAIINTGFALAMLIMGYGFVQRERASSVQRSVAASRGHVIERAMVMPSFANHQSYRSLYLAAGQVYVDKVRVPWFGPRCVSPGRAVPLAPPPADGLHPVAARGERLMRWFASDWVGYASEDPYVLGDLRYSFAPQDVEPIWGIRRVPVDAPPAQQDGVKWVNDNARRKVSWAAFVELVFEDAPDATCF
jgi:inner membrane protein